MSRPPRPLFGESTTGGGESFAVDGRFLPIEFADLVTLERDLAEVEARLGVTREPGDFAFTLFELSALVAHTLGLYQNLYSREAFITTATTARSLVRHARRLAYQPDQGLAASGYAVLTIGPGLRGTLPKGFAIASSPRGETKAQTFETLEGLEVDAARNEARPVNRERPATISFTGSRGAFWLTGRSLSLEVGAIGMLMHVVNTSWDAVTIAALHEDTGRNATEVVVDLLNTTSSLFNAQDVALMVAGAPAFRFLAMPKQQLRRFGWDAGPVRFPPAAVNTNQTHTTPQTIAGATFGYDVTLDSGGGLQTSDVYLSLALASNLADTFVVGRNVNTIAPLRVALQGSATVALRRTEQVSFPTGEVDGNGDPVFQDADIESQISGTVSYLRLETFGGNVLNRAALRLQSPLYAAWQVDVPVSPTEPNPDPVQSALTVDADFGAFRPGGVVVVETLDGAESQAREVTKLTTSSSGQTELHLGRELSPAPPLPFMLGNVKVLGNVVRVTHGESHEEILGGSDGVTMFQRFELQKAPVTLVPGAEGGEPALEVRVNDVAWTRVSDFYHSTPHDRHYRVEFDDTHHASVVFGNGIEGAIPPSGRKHIRAVYRHGLGATGNVEARAASRIKKAHPLVTAATNPTPLIGGADAASLSDLRSQATRFIRTFDRAVSIQDYADLALLFPGVARAAARPYGAGIEVIVATADGGPPALDEVKTYLNARRDVALALTVVAPQPVDVMLDITVEHDPAALTETVKRAVQDALVGADGRGPGLFTFPARHFGQAAHLSEVYERIAEVDGVTFVDVFRFRIGDQPGAFDVLQSNARQRLRRLPANQGIAIAPGRES
jgi:hypothetical protein